MVETLARIESLTGRDDDLARVGRLLARGDVRLVTLTGAGGVGKTQLALHVAAAESAQSERQTWHVELARITAPDMIDATIAAAIGASVAATEDPRDAVVRRLESEPGLLLLDAAEHHLSAISSFATAVLAKCPPLKLIVTSHYPLDLPIEHEYGVAPLSLPDAPQLFLSRALEARADLEVDDAAARSAAEIASRLGGVPLALELVAARARSLSLAELEASIGQRHGDDESGGHRRPAALRSTIQWTYDLLEEDERRLMRATSAFAAGWTTSAASEIAGDDPVEVRRVLQSLAAKRLIRLTPASTESTRQERWSMLDTIREFARDELGRTPERFARERALGEWGLDLARRADAALTGLDQVQWLNELSAEHENLARVLDLYDGEPLAAALAGTLARYWSIRGHWAEGRHALDRAVESEAGSPRERAAALFGAAYFAELQGDLDRAEDMQQSSERLWREEGNDAEVARVLQRLGAVALLRGDTAAARAHMEESLAIRDRIGDRAGVARINGDLGSLAVREGDFDQAEELLDRAVAGLRDAGELRELATTLTLRAGVAIRRENLELATTLLDEQVTLADAVGDTKLALAGQARRGSLAAAQGDTKNAELLLLDARQRAVGLRDRRAESDILGRLWPLARENRDRAAAAQWADELIVLQQQLGNVRGEAATRCARVLLALESGDADQHWVDDAIDFCVAADLAEILGTLADDVATLSPEWADRLRSEASAQR